MLLSSITLKIASIVKVFPVSPYPPCSTRAIIKGSMPVFNEEEQLKKLELLHHQEEEDLARILSDKYKLAYVDLTSEPINSDALRLVPEEKARAAKAAAFNILGKKVSIAVQTPNNEKVPELVENLQARGYNPQLFMASTLSLERAWKMYKEISFAVETTAGMIDVSNEEINKLLAAIHSLDDAHNEIESVLNMKKINMTSRILETVLAGGLALDASDIHLEPEEMYVRIRYRLDGVLTEVIQIKRELYDLLLSRIKLLSGLKINIHSEPQDGRFSVRIDEKDIEMRVSVLPGAYAESIVMRILDPTSITVSLESIGFEETMFAMLMEEIAKPNGMILNTGPTGSGKTTTLYAFLRKIHKPEVKIITIEDPVEYHLEGIVQTQTKKGHYTFAGGLRSALRQDPDVIMVGEIRDDEVAETAVHAALTGHLVFSTLHTNSAAGAFPRLINIGVDRHILSSAVNVVMAQRLVRILRPECSKKVPLEGESKAIVDATLETIVNKDLIPENTTHMWVPDEGADKCSPPYKGRQGVFEAIRMDEKIDSIIRGDTNAREIAEVAKQQGFLNMHQHGIIKVLKGETSLDEVLRVLGSDAED